MPEVDVRTSHTMIQAFAYYESAAHNGHEVRNVLISTVNLLPDKPYAQQFALLLRTRTKMDTDKRKQIQAILVIQSFAKDELDPDNPADWKKANKIGLQFAKEQYPDCQAVVYTQIDGQSGLIHNHIIACNCKVTDHKAIDSTAYFVLNARKKTNEVARRFGVILSAALSDKSDRDILYGTAADKKSKHERRCELKNKYSYEKDIKERVAAAMESATSEQDYYDRQLPAHGLAVSHRGRSKAATCGEYVIYELTDKSKMPPDDLEQKKTVKIISYKLGTNYEPAHLHEILASKQEQQQPEPEKLPETMPVFSYLYYTGFFCLGGTLFHQRFAVGGYTFSLAYTPVQAAPDAAVEQKPAAKVSDDLNQIKPTGKSAVAAAMSQTTPPDQTAPASDYDDYADIVTTFPRRRKHDGKINFDDVTKELTDEEEQKRLTQEKESFEAEADNQLLNAILREIQDFEFDDPMCEDDQPECSGKHF